MQKRDSKISPRDARLAVIREKQPRVRRESSIPPFAQNAARKQNSASSLQRADPFIAANASLK